MSKTAGMTTTSQQRASAPANVVPPLRANYKVKREQDGKIRVFGVPIFGENVRDFGDQTVGYDVKWLRAAVASDAQLRSEGYRAPMHFGHHEPGVDRDRAGEFELRGVARRIYAGKPTWILFADLVFDDEDHFNEFKKTYVYRSVEISPEKPDEINSLALLASEAPYFRFPVPKDFTFAYRALPSGGRAFLWRFPMAAAQNFEVKEVPTTAGSPGPGNPTTASGDGNGSNGSAESGKQAYDADGVDAPAQDGEVPVQEQQPDLAGFMKRCEARLQKMEAAIFGADYSAEDGESYEAEPGAEYAAEGGEGDEKAPGIKKTQKQPPVVAAAARGETLALKARLDQIEGELARERLFNKYSAELAPWLTTPQIKTELKKAVEQGESVVRAFATGLRSVKPARPRASEGAPVETVQDSPEVAKYATLGPTKHAEARRQAAAYNAAPKGHFMRSHSLEAWLRNNVGEV